MDHSKALNACNCHEGGLKNDQESAADKAKKTGKALPSFMVSILIAFFPKCPVCWAVYMSMFGSLGLSRLPYMPWLLPVLFVFLAFHLFMIFRKIPQKGYIPFIISLAGASLILCGRIFFPAEAWAAIPGMVLIITGSLFNNFYTKTLTI